MNYLLEYVNEIEKGNIIVGQDLKTELDKLVADLNNPKFIFDEEPGQLRIDFIEKFCKHTKSPFNGMPFILELWEKAFLQTAYGFKYASTGLRRFNEVILLVNLYKHSSKVVPLKVIGVVQLMSYQHLIYQLYFNLKRYLLWTAESHTQS